MTTLTKEQLMERAMTPCPNPLRTWTIGRRLIGYQRAADYWLSRGKNGLERPRLAFTQVTSGNDVFWRIIVGKSMFLIEAAA